MKGKKIWCIIELEYYLFKKNGIIKFAGKWREQEKNHPEYGISDPER